MSVHSHDNYSKYRSLKRVPVRALRANLAHLEPKTKNCFSLISFDLFIRRITEVLNFGIYFNFPINMVTKHG